MNDPRRVFRFLSDERRRKRRPWMRWIALGVAWLVAMNILYWSLRNGG